MKTKLLKTLIIPAFLSCIAAEAETLTKVAVQQATEVTEFTMYSHGKMYFNGNTLVIDTTGNGPSFSVALASIDKLLFSTIERSTDGTESIVNDASPMEVYPSMAEKALYVKGINKPFSYSIISVTGQTIVTDKCDTGSTINVSNLEKGVYFMVINGSIFKFVKL